MNDYIPNLVEFTADDEEPDCVCCDNILQPDEFCSNNCGPEHGWACYHRY